MSLFEQQQRCFRIAFENLRNGVVIPDRHNIGNSIADHGAGFVLKPFKHRFLLV